MIIHHEANTQGRDFVVGDLHGCRGLLENLLEKIGFDVHADRLFSVGDLVDRGPDSLETLALLEEPWFYAVLGNHEEFLLENVATDQWDIRNFHPDQIRNFGMYWFFKLSRRDHRRLLELVEMAEALPLVRVIGGGEDRFQVVHAELSASEKQVEYSVSDTDIDHDMVTAPTTMITGMHGIGDWKARALWGRSLIHKALHEDQHPLPWPDCSPVYCGHSIVPRPMKVGSHVYIDTGSGWLKHPTLGLSIVCPADKQVWTGNLQGIQVGSL